MRTNLRRGMTMIEVVISAAIFATLMAMVAQSMIAANHSTEVMQSKEDVTEVGGRVVHDLAFDLRDLALKVDPVTGALTNALDFTGPSVSGTTVTYTYRAATGIAKDAQPYGPTYYGYCLHSLVWDQSQGTLTQVDNNDPLIDLTTLPSQKRLLATDILPPGVDPKYPNGGFSITVNGRLLDVTLVLRRGTTFEGNESAQWVAEQSAVFVRSTLANAWGAQSSSSNSSTTTTPTTPSLLAPVITSTTSATGTSGQPFSYQIVATNSPTKYGITGTLPSGLAINPATGLLSGTPTVVPSQTSFPLTMSATNSAGTGSDSLTLDFTTANQQGPNVPVVTSDSITAQLGVTGSYQIIATNMAARYHPVGYAATGLPPGGGINVATGVISGTPTQVGTWTVQISATNTDGTGTGTLTITVPTPALPATPVVTGGQVQATQGTAFQYQIRATSMTTADQPVGYGYLPAPPSVFPVPGLSLDAASGLISGTPLMQGDTDVTLTAQNAGGTGSATLRISVQNPQPPATPVVTGDTVYCTVGTWFTYTVTATNMDATYYPSGRNGYSVGSMPGGLNQGSGFNQNTGAFSGKPTQAGTFTSTVTATNSVGSGSNQITFVISSPPPTPTPVVTSQSLATQQNASFTYDIQASYMTGQYSPSSYSASGLPAGLTLQPPKTDAVTGDMTAQISGTPTVTGTFTIRISATNGGGTGSGTLTLTVNSQAAPVPQVTSGSTSGQQTAAFSYQIQATNATSSYAPVSYSASGLPAGLSCDASTGLITGTPTVNGSFNTTLTVTNSYGPGTATLMISVAPPPTSPPVVSSTTQTIYNGLYASYTTNATNMTAADGAVGYAASGLPSGFACDASTGVISGTATATGTYAVTITATNRAGSGSGTLTLSVIDQPAISFAPTTVESANGNGGNVDVSGSKVTVSAPANYALSGNPSVSVSSNNLQYTITANSTGGLDVNFTGNLQSGASATVSATATRTNYPSITGSYTIHF